MAIEELMKDQKFVEKLDDAIKTNNKEQVKALLQEKGVVITDDGIDEMLKTQNSELDEDELEDVAGGTAVGGAFRTGVKALKWVLKHPEYFFYPI